MILAPPRSWLLKQSPFWHHDHVASVQTDIAFEILSGLIGPIIKHENVLAGRTAPPNHDAPLGGERTKAPCQRNGLHQRGGLSNNVGSRSQHLPGDKDFG